MPHKVANGSEIMKSCHFIIIINIKTPAILQIEGRKMSLSVTVREGWYWMVDMSENQQNRGFKHGNKYAWRLCHQIINLKIGFHIYYAFEIKYAHDIWHEKEFLYRFSKSICDGVKYRLDLPRKKTMKRGPLLFPLKIVMPIGIVHVNIGVFDKFSFHFSFYDLK